MRTNPFVALRSRRGHADAVATGDRRKVKHLHLFRAAAVLTTPRRPALLCALPLYPAGGVDSRSAAAPVPSGPRRPTDRVLRVEAWPRDVPRQDNDQHEGQVMTENNTFTMQAVELAELEQIDGGLVLTDGPIYAVKSSPGAGDHPITITIGD